MIRKFRSQHGFTLLEVLVALGVLAIAMGAILKAAAGSAANIGYLRDRTLASWVALNEANQFLLQSGLPGIGAQEGTDAMAGREWRWRVRVSGTDREDMRRLEITVYLNDEDAAPLTEMTVLKKRSR